MGYIMGKNRSLIGTNCKVYTGHSEVQEVIGLGFEDRHREKIARCLHY